jgi:Arc/MetJ-type ribon-helix-helix transcriptional regulator
MSDKRGRSDLSRSHGGDMEEPELEKVTIRLPERYVRALDFLVKVDDFPSRSEAIRAAIRDFIYERVDVVMDKVKKMEEAERTLEAMEQFESEYLRK